MKHDRYVTIIGLKAFREAVFYYFSFVTH